MIWRSRNRGISPNPSLYLCRLIQNQIILTSMRVKASSAIVIDFWARYSSSLSEMYMFEIKTKNNSFGEYYNCSYSRPNITPVERERF